MLNELFYETVPKILSEDDNNNMINSIENESPYLDKNLCEFMFSVPTKYLIKMVSTNIFKGVFEGNL